MSEPTSRETDNHELNRRGFTSEGVNGVLRIRRVPLGPTDHPHTSETSLAPAYVGKDNHRAGAANTVRELREGMQLSEGDRRQARCQAEQLVKDAIVSDVIKEEWMKLIQAEDIFASDATAFIPRVQEEETNPTFEHPED